MSALALLLALNVTPGNTVRRVEAAPLVPPVAVCATRPEHQPRAPKGWRPYGGKITVSMRKAADRQLGRFRLGRWRVVHVSGHYLGILSEFHCWPEKGWHAGSTLYVRGER